MVNKERLINEFIKLTKFDSESFNELEIKNYVVKELKKLGLAVKEDNSVNNYKQYSSSKNITNNVYAYLKGNVSGKGIIIASHLDTVSPGKNKKAILVNNKITSDGNTVLGADDLSAVASTLEAIKVIKENNLNHKDIELVFFVAEEPFAKGSRHFDYSLLKSDEAYVFDLEGNINNASLAAPSIISFTARINGKSAHAGFNPSLGINSLVILNNALNKIKLGKLDENTTVNIGLINGGTGINIVPDLIEIKGEIRSLDNDIAISKVKEIETILKIEASVLGGNIDFSYNVEFSAYSVDKNDNIIKRYISAVKKINEKHINLIKTFGGSDNNNLSMHNIKGVVVGNGMRNVHSKEEYILVEDLVDTAKLIVNLLSE